MDANILDVIQSIIVFFIFQWSVGAPSGWLLCPSHVPLEFFEAKAEARKLRCLGEGSVFCILDLSWPGP